MQTVRPLPVVGEVFLDARGSARALRLSWHGADGVVVLSLWRQSVCVASFQLSVEEVPDLIEVLRGGLARAYDEVRLPAAPPLPDVG